MRRQWGLPFLINDDPPPPGSHQLTAPQGRGRAGEVRCEGHTSARQCERCLSELRCGRPVWPSCVFVCTVVFRIDDDHCFGRSATTGESAAQRMENGARVVQEEGDTQLPTNLRGFFLGGGGVRRVHAHTHTDEQTQGWDVVHVEERVGFGVSMKMAPCTTVPASFSPLLLSA